MIQVLRRGTETWEVTRVTDLWKGAHEYESIGRVIRDPDGLYYYELPLWQDIGFAWDRPAQKGRLIPRPLFKLLEDGAPAKVME